MFENSPGCQPSNTSANLQLISEREDLTPLNCGTLRGTIVSEPDGRPQDKATVSAAPLSRRHLLGLGAAALCGAGVAAGFRATDDERRKPPSSVETQCRATQ